MRTRIIKLVTVFAILASMVFSAVTVYADNDHDSRWDELAEALAESPHAEEWIAKLTESWEKMNLPKEDIERMIQDIRSHGNDHDDYDDADDMDDSEDGLSIEQIAQMLTDSADEYFYTKDEVHADDNWKDDLEVVIDNHLFDMPLELDDVAVYGWVSDDPEYQVEANTTLIGTLKLSNEAYQAESDYKRFYIELGRVVNDDDDEIKPVSECKAITARFARQNVPDSFFDSYPIVKIVGDITFGSTAEEVEAVLGKPDDTYRSDDLGYTVYYYWSAGEEYNSDSQIGLTIYDKDGVGQIELTRELTD